MFVELHFLHLATTKLLLCYFLKRIPDVVDFLNARFTTLIIPVANIRVTSGLKSILRPNLTATEAAIAITLTHTVFDLYQSLSFSTFPMLSTRSPISSTVFCSSTLSFICCFCSSVVFSSPTSTTLSLLLEGICGSASSFLRFLFNSSISLESAGPT